MEPEPIIDSLPDEETLRARMVYHRIKAEQIAKLIKFVVAIHDLKQQEVDLSAKAKRGTANVRR